MKIKTTNYDITAKAEIDPGSNIWEVMDAIGGLLQVIGYGSDTVAKAIRDEDEGLWLAPTQENMEKWRGCECLCDTGNGCHFGLFNLNGKADAIVRFIPISTLCG